MDISQIIGDSFEYSKKLFSDLGRLAILVILDIIPIASLIVVGYQTRVVKETPTSQEPPPLRDYSNLFIQGLKVTIAVLLYMLIPMILIMLGAIGFILPMIGGRATFPTAMGFVLLAVGIVLAFCIAIIMSMAIVHMVKNNSFGKAFAVGEILQIIGKVGWGKYVVWLIVMFAISLAVGGLSMIPLIGWLLSLIVSPVLGVFAMRSAALIYNEAVPTTEAPPTPPPVGVTSTVKFCAHCGARMPADATFCPNCGAKQ